MLYLSFLAMNWVRTGGRLLAYGLLGLLIWYLLKRAADPMESISKLASAFDTKGGNILILVFFTIVFFISAMGLGYYELDLVEQKLIAPDNAMALSLLQFVTGTAFGACFGALVMMLGGGHSK